ncbi:MAG: DUF3592 domain-containing protein [Lentisphaeria bacterium]|nr:DUF3592 domain-containing protein [Lentisphaeria bacterium]NQZ68981.1 DUF3592 domain-containing protein [Lentisphaeria bacterium]
MKITKDTIVPIALLSMVVVLGLGLIGFGIGSFVKANQTKTWPIVEGVVSFASIKTTRDDDDFLRHEAEVTYDYELNGKLFTNRRIHAGSSDYSKKEDAQAVIDDYSVKSKVQIYYNPDNPRDSVLIPGKQRGGLYLIFGGLFFLGMASMFLPFLKELK